MREQTKGGSNLMTFWWITGMIILAGMMGGIINALLSDSGGFTFPTKEKVDGKTIWKPGAIGNMIFGGVAAFISWGLYGPFSQLVLIPSATSDDGPYLALETVVGALLVGVGGSRVITSEVEKKILTLTAATAAAAPADPEAAADIATASSPTDALRSATETLGGTP
jgi:hypothetical protein